MSPQHTRKSFFAKLAGFVATVGLAPKLLGKVVTQSETPAKNEVPFAVRTDSRAVSRSNQSV